MTNETYYGVISDIHFRPETIEYAIKALKKAGANKLILNGDIGDWQDSIEKTIGLHMSILKSAAESGLETYFQAGSHENFAALESAYDHLKDKYPNLIKIDNPVEIKVKNHHLIFIPGSDWNAGGEYTFGRDNKIPSGNYIVTYDNALVHIDNLEQYFEAKYKGIASRALHYSNINDLEKIVKEPEKSIVICHVPRRFNNLDEAVDTAIFGIAKRDFTIERRSFPKGSIFPGPFAKALIEDEHKYPVEMRHENRGNEDLRDMYNKLGITKAISGHFHESGHRANDLNGNHVPEGKKVKELFVNTGYFDVGQAAIVGVDEDGVLVDYHKVHF